MPVAGVYAYRSTCNLKEPGCDPDHLISHSVAAATLAVLVVAPAQQGTAAVDQSNAHEVELASRPAFASLGEGFEAPAALQEADLVELSPGGRPGEVVGDDRPGVGDRRGDFAAAM